MRIVFTSHSIETVTELSGDVNLATEPAFFANNCLNATMELGVILENLLPVFDALEPC